MAVATSEGSEQEKLITGTTHLTPGKGGRQTGEQVIFDDKKREFEPRMRYGTW